MAGRFVVDLTGLDLDDDRVGLIEQAINRSVLEVVSDIRMKQDLQLRFPREWLGIVVHVDLPQLNELDQRIQKQLGF